MTSPKQSLEKTCERLDKIIERINKAKETCTERFNANPDDFSATSDLGNLADEMETALEASGL